MFNFLGATHALFLLLSIIGVTFTVVKREYILKNYKVFWFILLLIGVVPELTDYAIYIRQGDLMRPVPLGMCHISFYLTTFVMLKYNRRVHIISYFLMGGAALALIVSAPIDGESLSTLRPYSYYLVHFYLIAANLVLSYKHKLKLSFEDYKFGIVSVLILATSFILSTLITKNDNLFFFSGPEGVFIDNLKFGVLRTVFAYTAYILVYTIPYLAQKYTTKYAIKQSEQTLNY